MSVESSKRLCLIISDKFREVGRPLTHRELQHVAEKAGLAVALESMLEELLRKRVLLKREMNLPKSIQKRSLASRGEILVFWPALMSISSPAVTNLKKSFEISCCLRPTEEELEQMQRLSRDLEQKIEKENEVAATMLRSQEDTMDVDEIESEYGSLEPMADKLNELIGDVCVDLGLVRKYFIQSLKRLNVSDEALELLNW